MSERIARLHIDMPLSTTLEALHEAIQMAMGWTFSHLWEFDIDGRCYGDPLFREFDDEPPVYKAMGLRAWHRDRARRGAVRLRPRLR